MCTHLDIKYETYTCNKAKVERITDSKNPKNNMYTKKKIEHVKIKALNNNKNLLWQLEHSLGMVGPCCQSDGSVSNKTYRRLSDPTLTSGFSSEKWSAVLKSISDNVAFIVELHTFEGRHLVTSSP
jgi:hypothetical protein